MPTLYIDRKGLSAHLDGGAIILRDKTERIGTIPIAPLERVVLRGDVMVDTRLLSRLGEKGVGVIILSGREHKPTLLQPRTYKDAQRRLLQYECSKSTKFRLYIAKKILTEKVRSSILFLMKLREECLERSAQLTELEGQLQVNMLLLQKAENLSELRGYEGDCARLYFEGLSLCLPLTLGFKGRNRRPPKDPVNAVLSLGYTLLTSEASFVCYEHGLDPYVSFVHELDYGRESLSCDLVEPFRSTIDKFAIELFQREELKAEHFTSSAEGCFMGKEARSVFYPAFEKERANISRRMSSYLLEIVKEMQLFEQGAIYV